MDNNVLKLDNTFKIIEYIKKNTNLHIDELIKNIKQNFIININDKDIIFLINLIINNIDLTSEIILQIFVNYQKKIDHKIILKKDDTLLDKNSNIIYGNVFLDIFYKFGQIFIIPQQIIVLWNEKIFSDKKFSSKFSDSSNDYDTSEIIIKNINYDILDNNIALTDKEKKYDYYMRKFGLKQYKFGFQTKFQLMVPLDSERVFLSVTDLYRGKIIIYFNNKVKMFIIKENKDLQNIIEFYENDLINIFKQNIIELYKHLYMFIEDTLFMNYLNIVFNTLQFSIKFIKKKQLENYIYVNIKDDINANNIQLVEPCLHEDLLNNIIISNNFFSSINKFIDEYVYFADGIAICQICGELLPSLFIKENLYVDKDKYIVNFNNDILQYDPYNNFSNVKLYFENIFYLFSYYTKLNFSIDSNFIIRLCLDTFIYINSERLNFEQKYKKDIDENNIFFLRLSNTFFESSNEKEKYKEKKIVFTNYIIFIIIISTLSIQDFDEIIYRRKLFTIPENPTFEDILCSFIDFLFKKFNYNYYNNDKLKKSKINRTIQIFYEIFNDEVKYIYQNKKAGLENFFIKKKTSTKKIDIPTINASYYYDCYLDIYNTTKQINTNICYYNINIILNNDIKYIKIYNYYNKNDNILYIDFTTIDQKKFKEEELLKDLLKEFEKNDQYLYIDNVYKIQQINNYYMLYNESEILLKNTDELIYLELLDNSNIFSFFMMCDIYLYKKELLLNEFLDILTNYINFLEKYLNVTITTNIMLFFNHETIFTRYNLFYYKIQILNICKELLQRDILYKNFKKNNWNFEKLYLDL